MFPDNMTQRKITLNSCPLCDAAIDSIKVEQKHSNGNWNEYVKFDCGFIAHYTPNFNSVLVEGVCNKSDIYKAWKDRRKKAVTKLRNYIKRLDVDDKLKSRVLDNLEYADFGSPSVAELWTVGTPTRDRYFVKLTEVIGGSDGKHKASK
jgi:hypothetical protein